jgi:hypothetical protein
MFNRVFMVQEETKENLRPERVEAAPEPEAAKEPAGSPPLLDTSVFSAVDPRLGLLQHTFLALICYGIKDPIGQR